MTNRLLLIAFCFFSFINTRAQSPQKDVESSIASLNKAMISQDQPALEKLTMEELSFGHSTGAIENKSVFIKNVMSGSVKFTQIENADLAISFADDIAIARTISSIKGTRDSGPLDIKIGILMIWKKSGDAWKLLARQGYKLP
jgi:ketosteroid isomerase-like protein